MGLRQLRYGHAALPQGIEHAAARRVGECAEHAVERGIVILNHKVKY